MAATTAIKSQRSLHEQAEKAVEKGRAAQEQDAYPRTRRSDLANDARSVVAIGHHAYPPDHIRRPVFAQGVTQSFQQLCGNVDRIGERWCLQFALSG
jgi:epoxyqueuosine reductase QueG